MSPPRIELLAPSLITEKGAQLNGTLLDNDGKQVHCIFYYHRSGNPHWDSISAGWFTDSPHTLAVPVETKWPNLQHEHYLRCVWEDPPYSPEIRSEIMRFWFIPYSPRAKGAPFLVTTYGLSHDHKTISLVLTTDIPVHLYARISTIAPFSEAEVETKRGKAFKHHPVLVWQWQWQTPQIQPSDTLTHTFVWEAPKYNVTYYIQAWGTTDGKTSPSRSPFFQITPVPPAYGDPVTIYLYPDYHPEVTTVDGHAYRAAFETWAQITSRPGMIAVDNYVGLLVSMKASTAANKYAWLYRSLLLFNTTEIPDGSIIDAAQLRLYCYEKAQNGFPLASLVVVKSSPLANTAIAPADYQNLYGACLSSTPLISSIGVPSFVYLPLNEAGRAEIVPQGITKLGLREAIYDVGAAEPPWAYNVVAQILFRSRDYLKPITTYSPQLMITYRPPA